MTVTYHWSYHWWHRVWHLQAKHVQVWRLLPFSCGVNLAYFGYSDWWILKISNQGNKNKNINDSVHLWVWQSKCFSSVFLMKSKCASPQMTEETFTFLTTEYYTKFNAIQELYNYCSFQKLHKWDICSNNTVRPNLSKWVLLKLKLSSFKLISPA